MESFQPIIDTREDALEDIKQASVAGLISAGLTTLAVGLAVFSDINILGLNAWSLVDVVLIAGLTYSIYYHQSRVGAVLLFSYHLVTQAMLQLGQGSSSGVVLALIFAFYYFRGILGTIAYHRMDSEGDQDGGATEESESLEHVEQDAV